MFEIHWQLLEILWCTNSFLLLSLTIFYRTRVKIALNSSTGSNVYLFWFCNCVASKRYHTLALTVKIHPVAPIQGTTYIERLMNSDFAQLEISFMILVLIVLRLGGHKTTRCQDPAMGNNNLVTLYRSFLLLDFMKYSQISLQFRCYGSFWLFCYLYLDVSCMGTYGESTPLSRF